MAGKKRVGALVERFEAAQRSTKSSVAAGARDAPEVVVDGSVEELIALFNGMARSLPDFPRAAYTRSTRSRPLEPTLVADEEPIEPQGERMWVEEGADADEDDYEEEELSTCDETASIHSLSSSFMSDSSFDDPASEASLYYELEYRTHHRHPAEAESEAHSEEEPDEEPEEELQPSKPTSDQLCDSASLEPVAAPVALTLPPPPSPKAEIAQAIDWVAPTPEEGLATYLALPPAPTSLADEPAQVKQDQHESRPKMPRALLPSRIPILRGSKMIHAVAKSIKSLPVAVSGGLETSRPTSADTPTAKHRTHCEPSVPRSPVKQEVCRRFAAANSPSPSKPTQPRKSYRRHSVSNVKPHAMAAAQSGTTVMTKRRSTVIAPSARFIGTKAPTSFVSSDSVTVLPAQPKSQFTPIAYHPTPINSRATVGGMRTRESLARPPTPPSAFTPTQNAEIRLDRIKSRLFDYENDPKRLEIVAANRARRKNLGARVAA